MFSNCLIFALWREWRHGGYILVRRSHYGWWPHFLWSPDLKRVEHYVPAEPNHDLPLPPPLFRGVVTHASTAELP